MDSVWFHVQENIEGNWENILYFNYLIYNQFEEFRNEMIEELREEIKYLFEQINI